MKRKKVFAILYFIKGMFPKGIFKKRNTQKWKVKDWVNNLNRHIFMEDSYARCGRTHLSPNAGDAEA